MTTVMMTMKKRKKNVMLIPGLRVKEGYIYVL